MLPLLRLPCALLALLLSAFGGSRFAVERHEDADKPEAPVVVALAVLPPAQVDLPGDWWCPLPDGAPLSRSADQVPLALDSGHVDPVRLVPGPRRGSAGGPRAP